MRVEFFDNPLQQPHSRDEVCFNQLGLYVFEDRRRIAVGFDISPFRERPSIDVSIINKSGAEEASLSIIDAIQSNFNFTMHLRNEASDNLYQIRATMYYRSADGDREVVDNISREFDLSIVGEQ